MSEASYTAWDDNLYEWPPPDGWYEASDGRWWPQGYGPPADGGTDSEDVTSGPTLNDASPDRSFSDGSLSDRPFSDRPLTDNSFANHGSSVHDLAVDSSAGDTVFADGGGNARNGSSPDPTFDPERTSLLPAGGFPVSDVLPPSDRSQEESRRRVYDELPSIDDVFGGVDPYSAIETAPEETRGPTEGAGPADGSIIGADHVTDPARNDRGADRPAEGRPSGDAGPVGPSQDADRWFAGSGGDRGRSALGLPAPLDDELSFDSAFDRVAESLRGDRVDRGVDERRSGSVEGPGPDSFAGFGLADSFAGPGVADGFGGPGGADGFAGPGVADHGNRGVEPSSPAVDPDATKLSPLPLHADEGLDQRGHGSSNLRLLGEDSATAPIDMAAIEAAQEAGASASGFDSGRTTVSPEGPPEVPALEGRFELPENLAGYVGAPSLSRRSGPRRWWPVVVLGIAVLAVAGSVGAYLLLRDSSSGPGVGAEVDATAQGAFANPYPVGTGVVVYYKDEATGEQRRWIIQVLEPVADATNSLVSGGTADAPPDGKVLAQARIRVAYQSGPEPASVADLRFNAVGSASSVTFDQLTDACPAAAPIDSGASLAALQSVEGNVCWRIPANEFDNLKLAVQAGPAAGTVHLSLQ